MACCSAGFKSYLAPSDSCGSREQGVSRWIWGRAVFTVVAGGEKMEPGQEKMDPGQKKRGWLPLMERDRKGTLGV